MRPVNLSNSAQVSLNTIVKIYISRAERKTIVTDIFMKSRFLHVLVPFYDVHVPPNFRSGCLIIY